MFCLMICSAFESELADVIPIVKTSIGGTRIIGRLCAGSLSSNTLEILAFNLLDVFCLA